LHLQIKKNIVSKTNIIMVREDTNHWDCERL